MTFTKKHLYRLLTIILLITLIFQLFHPDRHAKHYYFIPTNDIIYQLAQNYNFSRNNSNVKICSYDDIIIKSKEIKIEDIYKRNDFMLPYRGGEYVPKMCRPKYKVAIVIPYRERPEQLEIFLNYFHPFLQKQNIHYRIFVADQQDDFDFNRAKMFNVGAYIAIKYKFPCLILHDVDLLPLNTGNIYACTKKPRHMSSSIDIFRFNLPYTGLSGGVISILTRQFIKVNGMSNLFEGWGGEDDDFFERLTTHDFIPYRFSPELSKYTMLKHKKAIPNENRYNLLESVKNRQKFDGLSSIKSLLYNYTVIEKTLYTHIIIQ